MKVPTRLLILLLLAALIGIPPLLTGFTDLALARAAQNNTDTSFYYESAAKFLFWRRDLYEKAAIFANNDPERAIKLFLQARQSDSLSAAGQLKLGDALVAGGQTEQAVAEWQRLLDSNQEISGAAARLAQIYHSRQEFDKESRVLRRWLDFNQTDPDASERLGLLLTAADDPQAVSLLETAAAGSTQAAAHLEDLISTLKNPSTEAAFRLARNGQALGRLDEWPLAKLAFEKAVTVNPGYAEAWAWLGVAQQQTASSEAQQAFERAIQLKPQSAAIHAMYGTFLQQNGKLAEARAQFTTATQLEPGNPAWWSGLGGIQAHFDLAEALKAYIQSVNLAPQEAAYWYALAGFAVEQNAYIEDYGLAAALRAYALEPHNPANMDMLGRAQMAVGQPAEAEVMFKQALASNSAEAQPAIYHFHLGLLYIQTGQASQAKAELEQVLELDANGPYGAQAQKLIERFFP